jgi:hypothetical protein
MHSPGAGFARKKNRSTQKKHTKKLSVGGYTRAGLFCDLCASGGGVRTQKKSQHAKKTYKKTVCGGLHTCGAILRFMCFRCVQNKTQHGMMWICCVFLQAAGSLRSMCTDHTRPPPTPPDEA